MTQILGIDTGTTQTGYCIVSSDFSRLIEFGKVDNECILDIISACDKNNTYVVFERFAPQKSMGITVLTSIVWYGKFIRQCEINCLQYAEIYRRDVKKHLLGKFKRENGSADSQVRKALVQRLAKFDMINGKGTKDNQDFFYGCASTDVYAAIAVALTWHDLNNGELK